MKTNRISQKETGIGIVEMMVSLLIGAMLIAGTIALFNANRQSFRLQENLTRAQESGALAMDFLIQDLRIAGYPGLGFNPHGVINLANTLNDQAQNVDREIGGATVAVTFVNDQISTIFEPGNRSATVACNGVAIPNGVAYAGNRYWVRESPDRAERELVCQGVRYNADGTFNALLGAPQVLADGVESFQVLYGIDTTYGRDNLANSSCPTTGDWATEDARIDRNDLPTQYVTSQALAAAFTAGGNNPSCGREIPPIAMIRAIRIGLLVHTEGDVDAVVPAGQAYTILDRTLTVAGFPPLSDGRVRRVFTATVALRNSGQEVQR